MKAIVPVVLLLILSACSTPPTPPPPTAPPPTDTAVPPPPTATSTPLPAPTADPLLFHDDFDGALGEGWRWLRERSSSWSLTADPGWLQITARAGGLGDGSMTNVLLREAPSGDFELETLVKFRPAGNFQMGGLLIYQDDGDTVVFGRAYCDMGGCVGDGIYFDLVLDTVWQGQNFATQAPDADTVYLRLRRVGDTFSGLVSEDGEQWTVIGQHRGPVQPISVGLVAGQAMQSVPRDAHFDYFTITAVR